MFKFCLHIWYSGLRLFINYYTIVTVPNQYFNNIIVHKKDCD